MKKILYAVRHCKAEGQAPDAELTDTGRQQAEMLAEFLERHDIRHLISSPFTRAIQSAEPAAGRLGLQIEIDDRLAERVLSRKDLPDWLEQLKASFEDPDLKLADGESGREATERAVQVLEAAPDRSALFTHGNLMGLLLRHADSTYGFEEWQTLSNPDVYRIEFSEAGASVSRLWGSD